MDYFNEFYGGLFLDEDNNYEEDLNEFNDLKLTLDKQVWLASRLEVNVDVDDEECRFNVGVTRENYNKTYSITYETFFITYSGTSGQGNTCNACFLPVFLISPNAKLSGGNGQSKSPYILDI